MSNISGKTFDIPLLKRVIKYVIPYRIIFLLTAFLAIILAFLSPIRPILIQYAFDNFILVPDPNGLLNIILLLIGLLVFEAIFQFFYIYYANYLGQHVVKDLRVQVYKHIVDFKQKKFDQTPIGTFVTRVINDIETIADIFSQGLLVIIGDILKLIVIISVMFITDFHLAVFSLSTIPILIIATRWFKKSIKKAFQQVRIQVSQLNNFVQERIFVIKIIQLFNRESIEYKKFTEINKLHESAHIRSIWYYSIFFPIVEILSAISIALLMWWGGLKIINSGDVTLGELIAFILYIHMLFRPIRQLADRFNVLQMGMVASERVFNILDTDSKIIDKGNLKKKIKGDIEFKNVYFAYNNNDWVLKNISFKIKAGTSLALVGSTGSGKSSIINLLTRSYNHNKGEILIDNINYLDYNLSSYRSNLSSVLQDVFLFSDSIINNISLHNNEITVQQIKDAAKKMNINKFVENLPGKYNYLVKERGAMLSVGQKQLLSFLRAYVANPRILILDEATSNIDTESERIIQKAIKEITSGRTSILIAHRLATIKNADHILLLENGEIVESGNHDDLMKLDGKYKQLFDLQFQE